MGVICIYIYVNLLGVITMVTILINNFTGPTALVAL